MKHTIRRVAAVTVLGFAGLGMPAASASPTAPVAHQREAAQSATAFVFGREGGNIRPFTVTIDASGVVTATGGIRVVASHVQLSQDAVAGLRKLAAAEGFATMPARIEGARLMPDSAALYIMMPAHSGMKKVRVHGARNAAFSQLFDVLLAAAGLAY